MRALLAALACASMLGCASTPPPPPPATPEPEEVDAGAVKEEPPPMETVGADTPERARPPSTASYDEAMSVPEPVDIEDDHSHLTDAQLTGPMRAATAGCKIPSNAHLTIHTAVQNGRAIGVTVDVRIDKPKPAKTKKPPKPPTAAQVKAEKKAKEKLASCVDKNVRLIVWPPNRRRDSFTTEL